MRLIAFGTCCTCFDLGLLCGPVSLLMGFGSFEKWVQWLGLLSFVFAALLQDHGVFCA